MRIVIVIPAYNAAETIMGVFARIKIMKRLFRIIVIDDCSTDDTSNVLKDLKNRKIEIITNKKNMGYGAVQKIGFNRALELKADIVVLLHADRQYAPELIGKMIKPIWEGKADVVMGSRILGGNPLKGGMPLYKYIGNRILTTIENFAYGMNITEFHTGYLIYSKKTLKTIQFNRLSDTFHFDGEMVMMSGKKGLRIKEIGIPTRYEKEISYLKPIRYGLDILKIIIKEKMGRYDVKK